MKTGGNIEQTAQERTALLVLLRSGLWEREPEDSSCFSLSDTGWENVFRLAQQQTVTGVTFQGLKYLPDHLLPPPELLIRWTAEADAIERRNRMQNETLGQLNEMFCSKGLNPILQKGQGVAGYYENPLSRECGDIDLYFNNCRAWEKAIFYLRRRQVQIKKQADKGICYQWNGVVVEHHRRLLDLYNPFMQNFVNRLEVRKGYNLISFFSVSETLIAIPSPFLNLLLQNLHILKHTLGRGIGLRQLCDMARTCYRLHSEIDAREMEAVCRKLGLKEWCALLHTYLTDCLGLAPECLPYPETAPTAQPLTDIVWRGGNFGHYNAGLDPKAYGWKRKWQTARSFGHHIRFAFHYAPKEAFWLFIQLLKGQIK